MANFFFHFISRENIFKEIKKLENLNQFRRAVFQLKQFNEMIIFVHN